MKVCLLNDSFPPIIDGVANTIMNYAEILSEEFGDDAVVATPRYPDVDYTGYPYKVVSYQSLDTTSLTYGYRTGNPFSTEAMDELTAFSPDIIHTHCPMISGVMARLLRDQIDVPLVFTYHTKFDIDIARAVKTKALQKEGIKIVVDNISACDEVWTVSRGAGENLRSLGYEGEFRVVNNGVDFDKGRVDDQIVREVTKDYDLPEGIPVYLFVGRLMTYKGLPIILDALHVLDQNGQDFRMIFVGSGADEDQMKEKTVEYGISSKVFFTGAIHDRLALRAWNTRADLFLFPSTYDTNGIVVREAAACGLAAVLVKNSCAAEGITDGRNGYMIEENAESMAQLLMNLGSDLEAMRSVGQRAMDEIYISWSDAVHIARGYYEELISRKKNGEIVRREKTPTDIFFDMAARSEETSRRIREQGEILTKAIIDSVSDLRADARQLRAEARGKRESFIESLDEAGERILEMARKLIDD